MGRGDVGKEEVGDGKEEVEGGKEEVEEGKEEVGGRDDGGGGGITRGTRVDDGWRPEGHRRGEVTGGASSSKAAWFHPPSLSCCIS